MSTSHRQSVTLTAPQADLLKREAEKLGITVSDLIRRILDQWRESRA
jgi:predicted DNA-binding ribbon-helix-helix protein